MKNIHENHLFSQFQTRTSVRDFQNTTFSAQFLDQLKEVINCAPTALNGHDFSAIMVTDKTLKQQLAALNKFEKQIADCGVFIVFLMDNFALDYCQSVTGETLDTYFNYEKFMSSITDATIAATMVQDYAISQSLGTCFIGALRYNITQVQKILNLPAHIIPVLGLCIGEIANQNDIKPKLNKVMENTYCQSELTLNINKYNDIMKDYYLTRHLIDDFARHTMNHYLKTNAIKDKKELDALNQIVKTYWLKEPK